MNLILGIGGIIVTIYFLVMLKILIEGKRQVNRVVIFIAFMLLIVFFALTSAITLLQLGGLT